MNDILKIKNLHKTYYTKLGCVEALKDVNLNIKKGEILGVLGNSGCGKSTLLSIIAKLETETKGNIESEKEDYVVGYMMQNDALFPWLTILDNATLGLKIKGIKTKENIEYTKTLRSSTTINSLFQLLFPAKSTIYSACPHLVNYN